MQIINIILSAALFILALLLTLIGLASPFYAPLLYIGAITFIILAFRI